MINKVVEVLNKLGGVPCTACRYCTDGCPQHISIIETLQEVAKIFEK